MSEQLVLGETGIQTFTPLRADAIPGLYEMLYPSLCVEARAIVGDGLDEDVVQDAAMLALRALSENGTNHPGGSNPVAANNAKGWLFRIVHNRAVQLARRQRPTVSIDRLGDDEGASQALSAMEELSEQVLPLEIQVQSDVLLDSVKARLNKKQAQALHLHLVEDMSVPEISAHLGISENTIKKRIQTAYRIARVVLREP